MAVNIKSASFNGLDCHIIDVQVDISQGLSTFSIVGLPDISIREAKERVRSSIKNCGYKFPLMRKVVNLAPAQIPKHGSLFDLAIAIGILTASKQLPQHPLKDAVLIGELGLNGELKAVPGVLALAHEAQIKGFKKIFIPHDNLAEASLIRGINIYPLDHLKTLIHYCNGHEIKPYSQSALTPEFEDPEYCISEISGHAMAKRALMIAVAGRHNILLRGSPGCGKTMLARSIESLLPPLSDQEALESAKIFSIAGLLNPDNLVRRHRPIREVHHTASTSALIGGGSRSPQPGEISLAHHGVLLLDEIAEFNHASLESLRQPIEDGHINLKRANFSSRFPCNFMLVATMNPCPCGYHQDGRIACICTDHQIHTYQGKISGPIQDRFDLQVRVEKISSEELFSVSRKSPQDLHQQILAAQKMQHQRFQSAKSNSRMTLADIRKSAHFQPAAFKYYCQLPTKIDLSNRQHLKIAKVARTIADLESSQFIQEAHIAEALQYR